MSQWFGRVRQVINNNELHLPNPHPPLLLSSLAATYFPTNLVNHCVSDCRLSGRSGGGVASHCSLAVDCRCGKRHLCKWFHGAAVAIKSPALVWAAGNYNEITVIAANLTVAALTFVCAT